MTQRSIAEVELMIRHRHSDGAWGEMVEDRSHHGPSDHDPERRWGLGRLFRCRTCPEEVEVLGGPPDPETPAP